MSVGKKNVAVIVPIYKVTLNSIENISFRHLLHYLGKYDKYIVCPQNLDIYYSGFKIRRFNNKFFSGVSGYNKLMLSKEFYEAFSEYNNILIYQLDALVFSDELELWCAMNFDYIGAPSFKNCIEKSEYGVLAVGNGGLSLRNVKSFLKVLNSDRYEEPNEFWERTYSKLPKHVRVLNYHKKVLKKLKVMNNVAWITSKYKHNEDAFWSFQAKIFYPDFKIPDIKTALRFAFEDDPRYCFECNNYQLPFGCHAWYKYDRDFWEPYLLK